MKKMLSIVISLAFLGCTYEGYKANDYWADPGSIVKDPHFATYKEQRDALEKQYLHEEITYADYTEKVNALDAKYNKEVEERNAILSQP